MKPGFLSIVDKQRVADHRLHGKTSRTDPELAHYRRVLEPVPLNDLSLVRLPLVQATGTAEQFVLLGEIAQWPGQAVLIDLSTNSITVREVAQLELVPPLDKT